MTCVLGEDEYYESSVLKLNKDELSDDDTKLIAGVAVTLVLVAYNLFYNTLLINLRFTAKMRCVTWGLCIFDCFNGIICYACLRKPCQDRICTPWTAGKWLVSAGIMGWTITMIRDK